MEKFISTRSKNDLLKIGLYQILSACFGLLLFLWSAYETKTWTTPVVVLASIALLFFSFSILSGYQCLQMKEKALPLSFINQGIQLVGFNIMGFAFKYAPCFYLTVGVDLTGNFKFTFDAGIFAFLININNHSEAITIDLNIIALIIFVWLGKINNRIKAEQEILTDTRFL
jgi:hypothetical protein